MPLVCWCMKSSGNIKVMFLKTHLFAHLYRQCSEMAIMVYVSSVKHCYSSISRRRGPYRSTYAICQSPPPDSFKMSSGVTTLTLSSSNFTHSSVQRENQNQLEYDTQYSRGVQSYKHLQQLINVFRVSKYFQESLEVTGAGLGLDSPAQ